MENQIDRAERRALAGRRSWIVAAVLAAGVATLILVWFQPHKLFIDDEVDQALPTATSAPPAQDAGPGDPTTTMSPPIEPVDVRTGSFVGLDHTGRGHVRVFDLADGRRFVRFEGFETENGPDLFVYLSANPANGPESDFDEEFVNLGRLQGNIGDQNYELPPDTDIGRYASVVVWCDRFDSAFTAADLIVA